MDPHDVPEEEWERQTSTEKGGILDSFDTNDVIRGIIYEIRRYEEELDGDGNIILREPKPIKIPFFNDVGEVEYKEERIPPLVNRLGEHDISIFLRGFMNRNQTLSYIPSETSGRGAGKDHTNYIDKTCKMVGASLIDLMMHGYKKYNIKEPIHMEEIYILVMPNIESALRQALGGGGRMFVRDSVGETRTFIQRGGEEEG